MLLIINADGDYEENLEVSPDCFEFKIEASEPVVSKVFGSMAKKYPSCRSILYRMEENSAVDILLEEGDKKYFLQYIKGNKYIFSKYDDYAAT